MSTPYLPDDHGREPTAPELATSRDPRLGIAYAVSVRTEGGGQNSVPAVVLTYRLRRLDPSGRELPALQVEMRGRNLQGMVAEGDLVQAPAPLPPSGSLQLETVANLTTGSTVVLKRTNPAKGCWIALLVSAAAIVLTMVIFFLVFLATSS